MSVKNPSSSSSIPADRMMRIASAAWTYLDRAGSKGRPDHGCEQEEGRAGDLVARCGDASSGCERLFILPAPGYHLRAIERASSRTNPKRFNLVFARTPGMGRSRLLASARTHFLCWNGTLARTPLILSVCLRWRNWPVRSRERHQQVRPRQSCGRVTQPFTPFSAWPN